MSYGSMDEVRARNRDVGQHFFSPGAMAFFGSRVEGELIGGRFFLTSESPPSGGRLVTIRVAKNDGRVETVGEFCGYGSVEEARAALGGARVAGVRVESREGGLWVILLGELEVGSGSFDAVEAQRLAEEIGS